MNGKSSRFVGRQRELEQLRRWLREVRRSGHGKAIAVRGRRAVGKSTLIEEMLLRERVPHAFFTAAKGQSSTDALASFLDELQRSTLPAADELNAGLRPDSWEAALRMIARTCSAAETGSASKAACLVIDELPWLAEQEPSIEGLLQKTWDRQLQRLPIMVVLIGSDLHMMRALESYDRPLYGRLQPFVVEPLDPREVSEMIGVAPARALDAYCIIGGFPQLAATWRHGDTTSSYLKRELTDPTAPLIVTGERVMTAEMPAESPARAVVSAIGAGETEFSKILNRSGIGRTSLSETLEALTRKRIVSRMVPFDGQRGSRLTRYTISDPYLRFWLRFVAPNQQLIERRRGDLAAARTLGDWSTFRGHAIEPIVRASVERMLPDDRFGEAIFAGSYWTRNNEPQVDLVGYDDDRKPVDASFIGSIKWRETGRFSRSDAAELAAVLGRVPLSSPATRLVGVSRSGFSPDVKLDVRLGPEELLGAWS